MTHTPKTTRIPKNGITLAHLKAKSVQDANGCWIWQGRFERGGYPGIDNQYRGRRYKYAHRLAYVLHHDMSVEGMDVHHKCAVPACINPGHLMVVSAAANTAEMHERNRMIKLLGMQLLENDRLRERLSMYEAIEDYVPTDQELEEVMNQGEHVLFIDTGKPLKQGKVRRQ